MSSGCGDVLSLADLQTAKKHQIFEAEVITGKSGGVAGGADIDYATNQVTGQTQKTLPAVLRDAGFSPVSWDFSTGGTLTVGDRDKVVFDPVSKTWYSYAGTLPVAVSAGFNPVGNADWKPQTDPTLREELRGFYGSGLIGGLGAVVTDPRFAGGAKCDGVTDDFAAFKACADYATANNLPVIFPPGVTVKITGSVDVELTSGGNFNGSTLDISSYAGQIKFVRKVAGVTYDSTSSLVTDINAGSTLNGFYFPALVNHPEVNNCYLNIVSSQPYYTYRGSVVNRTERLISVRNGIMDGSLKYPLAGSLVTSVVAYPLPASFIVYRDLNIKIGTNQLRANNIYVEADMLQLINWTFEQGDIDYTTVNPVYVAIRNSSRILVQDFNMMWTNRTSANNFTYGIACEYSCDVKFVRCRGVGDGWGMTGFNENRKVTFDSCALNRIDTHQPFIEYLRVINCDVTQWGIHLTILGDLVIDGGNIKLTNDSVYTDKIGFITLREECGGIADGRLIMRNVALSNATSTTTQKLVLHRGGTADVPPGTSPVNYQAFSSIELSNLRGDDRVVDIAPQVVAATNVKYPANITARDCTDGIFAFNVDLSTYTPNTAITGGVPGYTDQISNFKLRMDNVNVRGNISAVDTSTPQRWLVDFAFDKLIGNSAFNPSLQMKVGGVISGTDTIWEGLDFFSGTAIDRYLRVNIHGGGVRFSSRFRPVPINGANSFVDISISGAHLQAPTLAALRGFAVAYLDGCTFAVAGGTPTKTLQMTTDGAASTDTGVIGINTKNKFMLAASVSGTLRRCPMFLPPSGGSSYVQLDNGVFANVTYNTSTIAITTTAGIGAVHIV